MALPMTSPSGSTHGPSMLASNSSPWYSPQGGGVVGAAARGTGSKHGEPRVMGGAAEGRRSGRCRMHAELARSACATAGGLARHDAATFGVGGDRSCKGCCACVPASVPCHRPAAMRSASTAPCDRRSVC